MSSRSRLWLLLSITLLPTLAGCHREPKLDVQATAATPAPVVEGAPMGDGAPAPVSGHQASAPPIAPDATLPAGHPPLDGPVQSAPPLPAGHPGLTSGSAQAVAQTMAPGGEGDKAVAWTAPASWVAEPPANEMRRAQYKVPGAGGQAECVVFYFGPGQGGDPKSNAERWATQFTNSDGSPAPGNLKTRATESGGMKVLFVETRGTYLQGSMAGGAVEKKNGYALLGAIVEGPDANWFFKLTGPEATVASQHAAFEAMIGSMKRGGPAAR